MPIEKPLRYLFIINPISGGNDKTDIVKEAKAYFEDAGHTTQCHELCGEEDEKEVARQIKSWKPDRVVAIGGDGTLKLVAEQVLGTDIPIGLLPAGSANGMAKELGLPANVAECLEIIAEGEVKPIDAIIINDKEVCIHLSDIGLNAQLVKNFEQSDRRGKWGYLREVFGVLVRRSQLKVRIIADGKEVTRKAFMIVIANARMYGMGAMINPEGDLNDGKLELVIVKKISLWELLKMMVKYRHFNPRKTEIIQAREATIISAKNVSFQVDGEYMGKINEVRAHVQQGALKMMLPIPPNP